MYYYQSIYLVFNTHETFSIRDAPEATGDEPDDADFEMPKIYEPVSCHGYQFPRCWLSKFWFRLFGIDMGHHYCNDHIVTNMYGERMS